ncbi:GSCFA domain-containing protein [Sphingomonas sabuli]|uniref:GSCFA domain-containing protein n=1 Tax=Sphingomonas sabuli TaxID=2764186 RepID=A0A7G9L2C3_9SPHN|nr:GSCFA domain-containing protein [Sphingomonas sabuli]QNM82772.1 GSCFA domain-containing protein [Sphingomonas sabuli]
MADKIIGYDLPTKDFSVADDEPDKPHLMYYQMAGKKRRAHGSWYRGETTNFHPMRDSLGEPDAVAKYVGHGWFPEAPFITRDHYITAFGSCFAAEVTKFLVRNKYNVFGKDLSLNAHVIRSGEGIVNTAALRQQFDWAVGDYRPQEQVWQDADGSDVEVSEEIRDNTRDIFHRTDVFIFTLGLSEVWYDKITGEVFWRAIPNQKFDPERHGFRVMGVAENRENITAVYHMIRAIRPDAQIIFTLSPVPLAATFRPISCITANAVSKASLRMAIDELMREFEGDPRLHYFPSYEIVTAFLPDAFGVDLRHPRPEAVDFIMRTFQQYFLRD